MFLLYEGSAVKCYNNEHESRVSICFYWILKLEKGNKEHELSLAHRDAIKARQYSQSTSVSSLLSSELKRNY